MTENGTDRLKEFRAQYRNASPWVTRLLVAQLVLMLVGFGAVLGFLALRAKPRQENSQMSATSGGLSTQMLRDYAGYLADKKQFGAAVTAYEEYLAKADLDPAGRAAVCYTVAKTAIDGERYDDALAYLYQSELLNPDSDLKDDVDKKIVLCLEKTGRSVDLRRELHKRASVKRTKADAAPDDPVLAEFADQVITRRDLELEIEKLPPQAREAFDTAEKKTDLLKNMVAERLLLDKAKRLELDKAPEIQDMLATQMDAMIVRKLIDDEVRAKVHVTPEDIERFYKAEVENFTEPATAQVLVGKTDTEDAARTLTTFAEKPVTVREGGRVPSIEQDEDAQAKAVAAIFQAASGQVTSPVQIGDAWYVFKIESRTEKRVRPFDEVKEQASRMYQWQKEQEQVQQLIEETLKSREVSLYPERIEEKTAA